MHTIYVCQTGFTDRIVEKLRQLIYADNDDDDLRRSSLKMFTMFDGFYETQQEFFDEGEFKRWFDRQDPNYKKTGIYNFGEFEDLRMLYVVDDSGNRTIIDDSRDDLISKYTHIVDNLVTSKGGYIVFYSHEGFVQPSWVVNFLSALKFCNYVDEYNVELCQVFAGTKYVVTKHDTESG
jgi:hypothetical protein